MNSGAYKFEKLETVEEKPTVSLYNLLDHSLTDLDILHGIVRAFTREQIEPIKESVPAHYTSAIAWMRILESAIKERDKTAKEINEQTK
jgi:hypothetical protein